MKLTRPLALAAFLFTATSLHAQEPKAITAARQEYEQTKARDPEAARLRYVTALAKVVHAYTVEFHDTGSRKHGEEMQALLKELAKHPAPKNADSKKLNALMVGAWETTRHEFLYRRDGTYSMLPIEKGDEPSKWRIQGNQFIQEEGDTEAHYTLTLLDADVLVYSDKKGTFLMGRMKKK